MIPIGLMQLYRKHRECLITTCSSEHQVPRCGNTSNTVQFESAEDTTDVATDSVEGSPVRSEEIFSKRLAAMFLLKTREERRVSQTSLNGIVQDLRGYWRDNLESLKVCFLI